MNRSFAGGMKGFAALFCVILVLAQSGFKASVLIHYQLNKGYIAANLCENRSKPGLHCNGKCYLKKQLKAQQKQEQRLPEILKSLPDSPQLLTRFQFAFLQPFIEEVRSWNSAYPSRCYSTDEGRLFRPPPLASV